MELFEQIKILNLDNIDENIVLTATVGGEKLILSKAKLYARLKPRTRSPKPRNNRRES